MQVYWLPCVVRCQLLAAAAACDSSIMVMATMMAEYGRSIAHEHKHRRLIVHSSAARLLSNVMGFAMEHVCVAASGH